MQRLTAGDFFDPFRIVIGYIGTDSCRKASFSFHRKEINNLTELLEAERGTDPPEGFDRIDNIIHSQYNDAFKWLGNLNEFNPDIIKSCKHILVGRAGNVGAVAGRWVEGYSNIFETEIPHD